MRTCKPGNRAHSNEHWRLAQDERDEFPTWRSGGSDLLVHMTAPRDQIELINWLRENPEPDNWQPDDWRDRCRDDFENSVSALTALAHEGFWPAGRWREALQRWSEGELTTYSWRDLASILANMPSETLRKVSHEVSWWLEKLARTFEGQEETFLSLCDRVLALNYDVEGEDDDPVASAINHPVGNVTWALLHWWHRSNLKDEQGLADEPKRVFTHICDTQIPKFRHGRVLLAAHVISLFRVDHEWSTQFVYPLFQWENSEVEARSAWEGLLWSARLYLPLIEALRPAFLETANRCDQLGRHSEQYASMITFVGLDPGDIFRSPELALAMRGLPQHALEHAAETFFHAVDSAGDQRADYWRNRALPYLKSIWPKTTDIVSEAISENFGLACVAAGDAFPEALQQVQSWLKPLQYPDRIANALHEAGIDGRFPVATIDLLQQTFGDRARGHFPELADCLNAIRAAQPKLEQDQRFQRLLETLRTNGGDLN